MPRLRAAPHREEMPVAAGLPAPVEDNAQPVEGSAEAVGEACS